MNVYSTFFFKHLPVEWDFLHQTFRLDHQPIPWILPPPSFSLWNVGILGFTPGKLQDEALEMPEDPLDRQARGWFGWLLAVWKARFFEGLFWFLILRNLEPAKGYLRLESLTLGIWRGLHTAHGLNCHAFWILAVGPTKKLNDDQRWGSYNNFPRTHGNTRILDVSICPDVNIHEITQT